MSNMTIDPPALSKGSTHTLLGPCRCESGWLPSQNTRELPTGPNWQQHHTPASACGHAQYRPPDPSQTWPPATAASASPSCLRPGGCCLGCRSTASSLQRSAAQRGRHCVKWVNKGQHIHRLTMPFCSLPAFSFHFICSLVCRQKKSTQSLDSHGQFLWNPSSRNVIYVQVNFVSLTGLHTKLLLLSWIQIHFALYLMTESGWEAAVDNVVQCHDVIMQFVPLHFLQSWRSAWKTSSQIHI